MNKKIIIVLSILVIISLVLTYPYIMKWIDNIKINKEINLVYSYIDNKTKYNDIVNNITYDYVKEVLSDMNNAKINDSLIDNLSNKDELGNILKSYDEKKNTVLEYKNKEISDRFDKNKIDDYYDKIINELDNRYEIIKLLSDNKKLWNIDNNELVFNKRKIFNEFLKYSFPSKLVSDDKGPVITANDISITKGDKLDIESKIKCVDEVDDDVNCEINGSYDVNKTGSYNIKISAKDMSGNTSEKNIKIIVKEKNSNKKPYLVHVIRNHNVVIVYGLDDKNNYTKIVKVFVCSVGRNNWTPTGTFTISDRAKWGKMAGGVYAQYYIRITGSYLFHSVPYFTKNKGDLEWEEYNKLGSAASLGCVRLAVKDEKWLYDNLPKGTTVKIFDGNLPSGVTKPTAIKIDKDSPNKGWDPTDPDKNNPWNK